MQIFCLDQFSGFLVYVCHDSVFNFDQPTADIKASGRDQIALTKYGNIAGAAADIDVRNGIPVIFAHNICTGAFCRKHRFKVWSGSCHNKVARHMA